MACHRPFCLLRYIRGMRRHPLLALTLLAGLALACSDPRATRLAEVATATSTPPAAGSPTTSSATGTPTATARTPSSSPVLFEAAGAGDAAAVRAQIAARANLDAQDAQGRTALFLAARRGHLEVARLLLAAGANVNIADVNADTPYYVAALARHAEMTGVLLDAGADRVGTRAYGGTPLIAIAERGWVDVAQEILKRPNIPVNHVNNLKWTALLEAIVLGRGGPDHQEIVRLLLAAGADPNIADGNGRSPLTLARERAYLEIAQMIESAGGR